MVGFRCWRQHHCMNHCPLCEHNRPTSGLYHHDNSNHPLEDHILKEHSSLCVITGQSKLQYHCPYYDCQLVFSELDTLEQHLECGHGAHNSARLPCNINDCDRVFCSHEALEDHRCSVHYKCIRGEWKLLDPQLEHAVVDGENLFVDIHRTSYMSGIIDGPLNPRVVARGMLDNVKSNKKAIPNLWCE